MAERPDKDPVSPVKQGESGAVRAYHLIWILVIAAALFVLMGMLLPPLGPVRPGPVATDCRSGLFAGWKELRYDLPEQYKDKTGNPPPEWTVPDLIRAVNKSWNRSRPLFSSCPVCFLPEDKGGRKQGYLVFPAPASVVLFDDSLRPPVPIVMDLPGTHGDFYGTNVLFSDGTVISLTTEEAEKLAAEQSPVPIEEVYRNDQEAEQHLSAQSPEQTGTDSGIQPEEGK